MAVLLAARSIQPADTCDVHRNQGRGGDPYGERMAPNLQVV
jgi:hypothetical protein